MNASEIEDELQNLDHFEEWLTTQSPDSIVGVARDGCGCPLFTFFSSVNSSIKQVGLDGVAAGDGRMRHTPLSRAFIHRIDSGREEDEYITVADAMQALKAAREAVAGY